MLKHFAKIILVAALALGAAALAGCGAKWSPADLETAPATVRIDGVTADAVAIDEALAISEFAAEDALAGTQLTFSRGDAVEWVLDAEGNPLTTDDGMAVIRVTQGEDKDAVSFAALVDARFLRLDSDTPFTVYSAFALLDAHTFTDLACTEDEAVLAIDTEVAVVEEIDGVLVVMIDGAQRFMLPGQLSKETSSITSRVDGAEVHAGTLSRDDKVAIIGEDEDYYVIAYAAKDGDAPYPALVPKWLVRQNGEAAPDGREGYATYSAFIYPNAFFTGEAKGIAVDTVITVLDEFGGVAFVKTEDGVTGYMPANQVTDTKNYRAPVARPGGGASGPQDGGDISLSAFAQAAPVVQAVYVAGISEDGGIDVSAASIPDGAPMGTILSDETPVFWAILDRGDAIHAYVGTSGVDTIDVGTVTVELAGRIGWMYTGLVRQAADAAFNATDLFTQAGTVVYSDWPMTEQAFTCARNDKLHVVDEFGQELEFYVVEADDGTFVYVAKGGTSETEIAAPVWRPSAGGGGGGGRPEWTDPVL